MTNLLTVAELGEQALIERIVRRLDMPAWVEVGPGDDAAVVKPPRGRREVLTTDALVDGVHFDRAFVPPDAIGHRALAVNLSDLAAMGAEPRAALLSLALPGGMPARFLDGFLDGFLRHAAAHRTAILGGNITRTPGPLVINVTAIGTVKPRRALTRAGARPGDEVYVTGWVGDAAAGLAMLQQDAGAGDGRRRDRLALRGALSPSRAAPAGRPAAGALSGGVELRGPQRRPGRRAAPDRRRLGRRRRARRGRAADLGRAAQPGTPRAGTDALHGALARRRRLRAALHGAARAIAAGCAGPAAGIGDLPITRIGVVTRTLELVVRDASGARELPPGFEHFR